MNWNSTSILSISLAVFAATPVLFAESSSLQVTDPQCEYATNPLGIDAPRPRLGWVLRSEERAQCQTAYQILVASDPERLTQGIGNKWDSGQVESDRSVNVPYGGEPLSSGERCYWKVRVWDRDGKASGYSEPGWFEMGLLEPSDFGGKWIGAGAPLEFVPGRHDKAFRLGGNQTIRIPHAPELKPKEQITICAWIRPTKRTGKWQDVYRKEDGTARHALAIGDDQGVHGLWFGLGVDGHYVEHGAAIQPSDLYDGRWHFVAATFDSAAMEFFLDGRRIGREEVRGKLDTAGSAPVYIGSLAGRGEFFHGDVDDVRLYRRALSLEQLKTVAGGGDAAKEHLAAYWPLDGDFVDAVSKRAAAAEGTSETGGAPLLRKRFALEKPIRRARVYISGIGWSELWINGRKVGDHVLDPNTTDYDKRILYVTHDVTDMLRPGENVLGVMLGNGWYSEPGGPNYGDSPRLLLQLIVELADGTVQRIVSDSSWRATGGPILKNDFYGGELYDARLEKDGWLEPGYEDASWPAAALKDAPGGRLDAQLVEPIKINQVLKPVALTNPKPGVYVYDFGQLFGGWTRLRVKGPAGTKVALRYASRIFPDGDMAELKAVIDRDVRAGHATPVVPGVGLVDKRHHHGLDGATDVYILKGDPRGETYEPRFTFHPVRYVQVEGFPGTPTPEDLEGCVVYNAIDMAGDFECSHPLLNQIHRNCVWTFTNAMYGITLDCLYREHWGWLEPASNPAMLFARKFTPRFWTKFLRDAKCAQHPDGVIPDVVPSYPRKGRKTGDPAWAGNYPLVLWYVYRYYDDRRLLEEHYASMKRWVAYLTRIAGENHRIEQGGYYGDHMLPGDAPGEEEFLSKETPPPLLWTGYYYRNVWILAQVARILGNEDDAAAYDELAAAIRAALNDKWLDASGDHYAGGSQTANIFPLALGVVPEANRQRVLQTLIDDILVKRRGHLRTGNLGTTCIMDALTPHGGGEALFQVATSTDYPGWGYMVSRGATTIWESWGGVREGYVGHNTSEDSMVMFVTIERFFYNDILGIQGPKYFGVDDFAPGFRAFSIEPCPVGDLTWAKGHIKTVRGPVAVDWKGTEDSFSLKVAIPVGATARVGIPKLGLKNVTVTEGATTIWKGGKPGDSVEGIDGISEDADRVRLEVGSGEYRFVLRTR